MGTGRHSTCVEVRDCQLAFQTFSHTHIVLHSMEYNATEALCVCVCLVAPGKAIIAKYFLILQSPLFWILVA